MFRKAKQSRVFQDVVEQIQEAVVSGRLKAGDQLPAERELKEKFNVSRGTLREALRVLEQKGLIEIRTGVSGGSVIKGVTVEQVSESLDLLIRYQKVSLQNLADFRESIEGNVASTAAMRATSDDVDRLKRLLAAAEEKIGKGPDYWDAFLRDDEEFHLALAEITRNPLYISVLQTVYLNIHSYYEKFLPMERSIIEENFRDLTSLLAAVEEHDVEGARRIAQDHVQRFTSYMEKRTDVPSSSNLRPK